MRYFALILLGLLLGVHVHQYFKMEKIRAANEYSLRQLGRVAEEQKSIAASQQSLIQSMSTPTEPQKETTNTEDDVTVETLMQGFDSGEVVVFDPDDAELLATSTFAIEPLDAVNITVSGEELEQMERDDPVLAFCKAVNDAAVKRPEWSENYPWAIMKAFGEKHRERLLLMYRARRQAGIPPK